MRVVRGGLVLDSDGRSSVDELRGMRGGSICVDGGAGFCLSKLPCRPVRNYHGEHGLCRLCGRHVFWNDGIVGVVKLHRLSGR